MHMMIGRRLSSFKITHPEGWQKLDNLDEIRTGGIVILRNVYDSFAQLQNLFQPKVNCFLFLFLKARHYKAIQKWQDFLG